MLVLFDIVYIILLLKLEMKENWQVRGPLQPCAAGDILKSIFEHFKRSLFGFCHFKILIFMSINRKRVI